MSVVSPGSVPATRLADPATALAALVWASSGSSDSGRGREGWLAPSSLWDAMQHGEGEEEGPRVLLGWAARPCMYASLLVEATGRSIHRFASWLARAHAHTHACIHPTHACTCAHDVRPERHACLYMLRKCAINVLCGAPCCPRPAAKAQTAPHRAGTLCRHHPRSPWRGSPVLCRREPIHGRRGRAMAGCSHDGAGAPPLDACSICCIKAERRSLLDPQAVPCCPGHPPIHQSVRLSLAWCALSWPACEGTARVVWSGLAWFVGLTGSGQG